MSTRYNTGNPIESTDVRDMSDNAKNFDGFVNSTENSFIDRLGVTRKTIHGMNAEFDSNQASMNAEFESHILSMGFTRVGTFAAGATLTNTRQTLLWDVADGGDGQEYGWSGAFPKVVPPLSTPNTTGGIAVGAWMSRFDPEMRGQVREALRRSYAEAGYNLVNGSFEAGGTLVNANDVLLQERTGKAFSGYGPFPQTVVAGANPASGGFVDVSNNANATFETVAEMKLSGAAVGCVCRTKGYYHPGDGGGGTYVVRGHDFPITVDHARLIHPAMTNGNTLELQFTEHLNFLQAGGKPDWDRDTLSGTDNTPILQNAIDYLFPFVWKGTVAATNATPKKFRCPIFVPSTFGKYMLGDVVKLNPFTSIVGPKTGRGFGMSLSSSDPVGAFFVPNFATGKTTKYIFDAAPYNSSGVRVSGASLLLTNSDKDNGIYTSVDVVTIENVLVCPDFSTHNEPLGDIHFSPLRLFGSSHRIKNNYFGQTLHGPVFEACWDYDYDGNLVQTFDSAIAIYQGTVGNIGGINYCNKLGARVRYGKVLPLWWPAIDGSTFIADDYDVPSSIVIKDVTSGRVQFGTWIQEKYNRTLLGDNSSLYVNMVHSESIDKTLLAIKGCNLEIRAGKTFIPSNRLYRPIGRFGGGSKATFRQMDFGCTGPLAAYIEDGVEINLLNGCVATNAADGTQNQGIIQTTKYTTRSDTQNSPSVFYEAFDTRATREIFVNVLGTGLRGDTYYGYDDNSAMETLDAALARVRPGDVALIKLRNGSSSTTSQTFTTIPTVNGASVTISLRFNNRPHTITGYPFIKDSTYRIESGIIINGQRAFQIEGTVSISVTGTCIIDTTSETFAVAPGKTSALTFLKQDTAILGASGSLSNNSSIMSVNFMNASSSTTVPAGGWGVKTKVI